MSRPAFELDHLRAAALACPGQIGVSWKGGDHTFAELDHLADRIVELLNPEPERVGVALANGPGWVPLLSALWAGGCEAVLFPASLPDGALVEWARRERVGTLVVDARRAKKIAYRWPARVISASGVDFDVVAAPDNAQVVAAPVEGPGVVLFTSGTTGEPKPVRLTLEVLCGIITRIIGNLTAGSTPRRPAGAQPPGCYLIGFPLYHVSGLFPTMLALLRRSTAVTLERFSTTAFLDALQRWPIKQVILNPTMFAALLDSTDTRTHRLVSGLRFIRNGTAPLPAELRERFDARFGVPILQGYGSTETGGEVVGWTACDYERFGTTHAASVGRPSPGVSLTIRDDTGCETGPGVVGRVMIGVPWLFDDQRDVGDLGYVDDSGFLFLTGRADDVINCGGFMIHPLEVEDVLRRCPGVTDCAVVAQPDERLGQVSIAYVVGAAGVSEHAVHEAAREMLPPYKCPREVRLVQTLPRNELGKVLRSELRSR